MDKSTESDKDKARKIDTDEVPDKQLHRWKGEGGAMPPEPETDSDPEAASGSESRLKTDGA